jgi:hypothetical protein
MKTQSGIRKILYSLCSLLVVLTIIVTGSAAGGISAYAATPETQTSANESKAMLGKIEYIGSGYGTSLGFGDMTIQSTHGM